MRRGPGVLVPPALHVRDVLGRGQERPPADPVGRRVGHELRPQPAVQLAQQGATVAITSRSMDKGAAAAAEIAERGNTADVPVFGLDLGSFASIRDCAKTILDKFDRLDVLVNNAGAMLSDQRQTVEGFEMTLGGNHLGTFLLTSLLLDRLRTTGKARIVTVASIAHRGARNVELSDFYEQPNYRGMTAYSKSKLANILFAREISRATELLRRPPLAGADLIALQEMDDEGVDRIARSLRLDYVYYPATIHPTTGKPFGPAILSRWPIERSWKVILPHPSRTRGQRRTATAAVLRIRGVPVLAYAVHLETPVQITPSEREDQARTILRDAASFPGPVVIAGDFNEAEGGAVEWLLQRGFVDALSQHHAGEPTWRALGGLFANTLDHVLSKRTLFAVDAWVLRRGHSDHWPLVVRLRRAGARSTGVLDEAPHD